jgi:hypothetical protein
VVQRLPSVREALGSIPAPKKKKTKKNLSPQVSPGVGGPRQEDIRTASSVDTSSVPFSRNGG